MYTKVFYYVRNINRHVRWCKLHYGDDKTTHYSFDIEGMISVIQARNDDREMRRDDEYDKSRCKGFWGWCAQISVLSRIVSGLNLPELGLLPAARGQLTSWILHLRSFSMELPEFGTQVRMQKL
ncbi:hypothetical protein POM88_009622 [Heracleum sosnowskyi]|uniref:Uncharacterized protein n=1 Tax=Heracleum sosnowskyi TaxID=360622 RepID=A0AAD8J936_9APIA|nr:hypothetical protein POM88_009622 [Heracleum sosnowskyi]